MDRPVCQTVCVQATAALQKTGSSMCAAQICLGQCALLDSLVDQVKIGSMPSTLLARINKKRLGVVLRLVSGALILLTRLIVG